MAWSVGASANILSWRRQFVRHSWMPDKLTY